MAASNLMEIGRKLSLEELPRDELLKKCKSFITIAQKAKQSKDALQEEHNELKNKLSALENAKPSTALEEIVETLTQQKLTLVTQIEDLTLKFNGASNALCSCQEKCVELDNENISFKRQNKRLTDENEQLLTHLDSLEKQIDEFKNISLQQQEQLLALEKSNNSGDDDDKINELQNMLSVSLDEVKKLKIENERILEKVENLKITVTEKDKNILTISEELEKNDELYSTNQKLKEKLKIFHSKIVKFAGIVKSLKEERNTILTHFKMYTDQVKSWKEQLSIASKQLIVYCDTLEEQKNKIIAENDVLKQNNEKMKQQLEAHKTDDEKSKEMEKLEVLQQKNKKLSDDLLNIQSVHKDLLENLNRYKETLSNKLEETLKNHGLEIMQILKNSEDEKILIENKIGEYETEILSYKNTISSYEEKLKINDRNVEELQLQLTNLKYELEHSKSTELQFAEKSSEEIMKLVHENKELLEANTEYKEKFDLKLRLMNSESQTDGDFVSSTDVEYLTLKRENTELLTEMNEMNQALKERGETISKLQAHCEEIMKKLQIYETQANKNVDSITQKDEIIKNLQEEIGTLKTKADDDINLNNSSSEKDGIIKTLRNEIEIMKEKINNANMETSYAESENMSTSTISKTEDANRLKDLEGSWEERYGKLRNLALKLKGKIRELTAENNQEASEKNELAQKLSNNIKTIQTLQSRCDKLEDELGHSKKLSKENSDQTINKLKTEIEDLKKEKSNTEVWKKQVGSKVQMLRKEVEAHNVTRRELESTINKLKNEIDNKEHALKLEIESHKQTKQTLEQSNNEIKKNSVLNLEMQDYERSVKELSQKLERKQELINKLKTQVDSQKSTVNALREQHKLLEEQIQSEEKDMVAASSEINTYKKKINDLEEIITQKEEKIQNVTHLLETSRSQNEELSTEISKVISEHQKVNNSLKSEKDHLRSQFFGLQQTLREVQEILKLKEDELSAVQVEYESYKVRAQSVLRQNQNRDVGLEDKLSEEVTTLKGKCDILNSELTHIKEELKEVKKKNEQLLLEKNESDKKWEELSKDMEELKNRYEQLNNKHQQTIAEHAETVRSLKVHSDTLAQCYRQQLSEQEVRHNREIIELQSKLDKVPPSAETVLPVLPSMPREEGEGSESVESNNTNNTNNTHPVPLERLLGADMDQEMMVMKKFLNEQESKVAHLTALLSDTEQDLAKHVQMNKLLKEEIRRQQRSVEREKHAENLEYLKNVVFKFVTLGTGDERSRLVPVLNTILKLSPEETQKLNMVAKGEAGLKGWSNYLPYWSSPNKPH